LRVTILDLVVNSLRMRPERIAGGEVRNEAFAMLQAMNTGHDGSLTTLHANTPRDAIARLETMVLMAGLEFPAKVIREQIATAIDLIVQEAHLRDGSRQIVQITEVQGMEGDIIVFQDISRFVEKGTDPGWQGDRENHADRHPSEIHPASRSRRFRPAAEHLRRRRIRQNDRSAPTIGQLPNCPTALHKAPGRACTRSGA
jgi:hypothetical protein